MAEPLANEQAVREKTARLRKLRLARDAAAKKCFPTINAGKPWSELDLEALWSHLRQSTSLQQIAQLLAREVIEIKPS